METVTAFLSNPTVRRLAVTGASAAVVALNHKLGLGLDTTEIGGLVALAIGYLLQSAATDKARIVSEANAAAAAASAKVVTVDDAAKVLALPIKPEVKP
jgi:hypothetical protein